MGFRLGASLSDWETRISSSDGQVMPMPKNRPQVVAMVELVAQHTLVAGNMGATRQILLSLARVSEHLVVDFSKTKVLDAAFLGVLVAAWARLKHRGSGGKLAVCGLDRSSKDMLRICQLDKVFMICPTRREALDLLG